MTADQSETALRRGVCPCIPRGFGIVHSVCDVCHLSQPARTFLSPKTVSVALGVGDQRRGSGFRRGSTRAQGLRPRPARAEGIWRLGWSPRTHRTAPWRTEASSVPRSTRTPRKRPAGWAQLELNLLDAPDCCIIIFTRISILWFIFCRLVTAPTIRQSCVCASKMKLQASVCLIKTSRLVPTS